MKWISVKDEFPLPSMISYRSKSVLIYCDDILCQFTGCYNFNDNGWEYFGASGKVMQNVTHWKPLGPAPELEK